MSIYRYFLGLAAPALLAQPAGAKITLGEQFFFKDWAVACDNVASCEAVSLPPVSASAIPISMSVSREGGAKGQLTVTFSGVESSSDRYRILIDRRVADSGSLSKGETTASIAGPDALKLVRAVARGSRLEFVDGAGVSLGTISLAGATAAFRHFDQIQGRAGTSTALIARGKKTYRQKLALLPVINARRIGTQDSIPDTTALVKLAESSECADERIGVTQDTAYSLGRHSGKPRALVLISCGNGAYNFSSAVFIGTRTDEKQWKFEPAQFDYRSDWQADPNGIDLLVNADWDSASQQLSSYAKGRGIGDCGNSETYVWDGAMFRLVSALGMAECRGSLDWMTLWRATVEFKP